MDWPGADAFLAQWLLLLQIRHGTALLASLGQVCPPALEARCDEWFLERLSGGVYEAPAPAELAPWIWARLASARSAAAQFGAPGETPDPPDGQTKLQFLLLRFWHADLKHRWADGPPLGGLASGG